MMAHRARAVTLVLAGLRYETVIPLGIHRKPGGVVTSVAKPAASSAALHIAIA